MAMVATVRYPKPGGVSQLASVKITMTMNSAITCMAPKAVVPHSMTTRRRKRRPSRSGCHAGIASKATAAENSMVNDSTRIRTLLGLSATADRTAPASATQAWPDREVPQ